MSDTTSLGHEFRQSSDAEVSTAVEVVQPDDVAVCVNRLEIRGENGPLIIDGQEVRHVTGIKLEWKVGDAWRAEITKLILP